MFPWQNNMLIWLLHWNLQTFIKGVFPGITWAALFFFAFRRQTFVQDQRSAVAAGWLSTLSRAELSQRSTRLFALELFQVWEQSHFRPQSRSPNLVYEGVGDRGIDPGRDFVCPSKAAASTQQLFPHRSLSAHAQGSPCFQTKGKGWELRPGSPTSNFWRTGGFFLCCSAGGSKPGI